MTRARTISRLSSLVNVGDLSKKRYILLPFQPSQQTLMLAN